MSPEVCTVGGRKGYDDDGQTPNTVVTCHAYKNAPLIFEVRGLPEAKDAKDMDKLRGVNVGVIIECEGGSVVVGGYTGAVAYDKDEKEIQKWSGSENHFKNFTEACRSRRIEDLNADILQGHLSSALCHTSNISYRLGRKRKPDEILERIKGEKGETEAFERMKEHLAKNEVDIAKDLMTLGPILKMNPEKERFIKNDDANVLLKDKYRKPYVVPEEV